MSNAYYVHKDDADRYDACTKETDPFIKQLYKAEGEIVAALSRGTLLGNKEVNEKIRIARAPFESQILAIRKKYDADNFRVLTLFDPKYGGPEAKKDYLVYYRGFRWGNCGDDIVNVAIEGAGKCLKIINDAVGKNK